MADECGLHCSDTWDVDEAIAVCHDKVRGDNHGDLFEHLKARET
ncbi:unannotated protein [freshwater metagenome]|uniref:Unannotated protein n=1 Tax=freshwater metagenome TaxID=449393 RepID=A0A6J6N214_9ZZZZ